MNTQWRWRIRTARTVGQVLRVVRRGCETPPVVWDIGANCGHDSLLLAPHARTVHAFEPLESLCASIATKGRENGLHNVIIHRLGLGDRDTVLPFVAPSGRNLGEGAFYQAGVRDELMASIQVADLPKLPMTTGDALVAAGVEPPGLIKMDIQEFEYQALVGMRDTLHRSRPVIVLEYGCLLEAQTDGLRGGATLFGEGYRWHLIRHARRGFRLDPFEGAPPAWAGKDFFVDVIGIPQERSGRIQQALAQP